LQESKELKQTDLQPGLPAKLSSAKQSSVKKQKRIKTVFRPRTMGVFILLIIVLSFIAGAVRGEMVLTLTGAVFLAVWAYMLIMILILALFYCRRAGRVSVRIAPSEVAAGELTQVIYSEKPAETFHRIWSLPGIIIRYRLLLSTKDKRRIVFDFLPEKTPHNLTVKKRGAYFSDYDELAIFDITGFFKLAFRIKQDPGVRLLVSPYKANEPVPVQARAGEANPDNELTFQFTDNLIEHRPYVPGDDPRRINWKLYGHGGELFVREGEREPPPNSNILLFIDTQFDPELYSLKTARQGIDLLCENALATALVCIENGLNVKISSKEKSQALSASFSSGTVSAGNVSGIAAALAWPSAKLLTDIMPQDDYSITSEEKGIIIFALPRETSITSSLDRFIQNLSGTKVIDIIFVASTDQQAEAAFTCASLYNRRLGIRARVVMPETA